MARDKSINIWQTGIFIFIIIFANKVLLLPSLLYRDANVEGIFCYLILFLLEIGLIFLFIVLKSKFPNVSFASLVKEKFGIVTLKIIYFLLIIFFFCKLILIFLGSVIPASFFSSSILAFASFGVITPHNLLNVFILNGILYNSSL